MGRPKGSKNKVKKNFTSNDEEKTRASIAGDASGVGFQKGDVIYYVWCNYLTGVKQMMELRVRTVYADCLIAAEKDGCSHMIGLQDYDNIFYDHREAEAYYKTADVEAKYG